MIHYGSKKAQANSELYAEILQKIVTGEFKPGRKLVEDELAQLFNVSRTPVREVLFKLEEVGLVERVPNQGARVAAFTPDDVEEIYDVRKALECLSVRSAVANIKLNDLLEIEQGLNELNSLKPPAKLKRHAEIDMQLHGLIISRSSNRRLIAYLGKLSLLIHSFRLFGSKSEHHLRATIEEHLGIVRALMRRDAEVAERLLGEHIDAAKRRIIDLFCQPEDAGELLAFVSEQRKGRN